MGYFEQLKQWHLGDAGQYRLMYPGQRQGYKTQTKQHGDHGKAAQLIGTIDDN